MAAGAVGGVEAALLAHVPVEFHGGRAVEQHAGEAATLRQEFVDGQHGGARASAELQGGRLCGDPIEMVQESGSNADFARVVVFLH